MSHAEWPARRGIPLVGALYARHRVSEAVDVVGARRGDRPWHPGAIPVAQHGLTETKRTPLTPGGLGLKTIERRVAHSILPDYPSRDVIDEPRSEADLLARARGLSGLTLAEAAAGLHQRVPEDLMRHKGWTGQLLERILGATAASRDVPDFEQLGIELKTLPVDERGRPVESTFVCTLPLQEIARSEWEVSRVRRKLNRVLWMPVEGSRRIRLSERRLGEPMLWSPSEAELATLKFDWDTLAGIVGRGDVESITGHLGIAMQVRPKARNASARRWAVDEDGVRIAQMPRGFYLRAEFTHSILKAHFRMTE